MVINWNSLSESPGCDQSQWLVKLDWSHNHLHSFLSTTELRIHHTSIHSHIAYRASAGRVTLPVSRASVY